MLKKIKAAPAVPPDPFLVTCRTKRRVRRQLVDSAGEEAPVLNVGAGSTYYHESPMEMRRATRHGLASLRAPLEEVGSGVRIGPASATTRALGELLAQLVSGGSFGVYRRAPSLIGRVPSPPRHFDYALERVPHLHTVASSC